MKRNIHLAAAIAVAIALAGLTAAQTPVQGRVGFERGMTKSQIERLELNAKALVLVPLRSV
jgi:hypothetical protein